MGFKLSCLGFSQDFQKLKFSTLFKQKILIGVVVEIVVVGQVVAVVGPALSIYCLLFQV
jgi:hypothetical protein